MMQRFFCSNAFLARAARATALSSAAIVGAVAVSTSADAVVIRNETTDTVLFQDDFEGAAAISAGFADDPGTVDHDPTPIVGTWTINEEGNQHIQVTDFAGTTTTSVAYPGAAEGDNYLWLNRENSFNGAYGAPTSLQSNNGDLIHIEWMGYLRPFTGSSLGVLSLYQNLDGAGDRIIGMAALNDNSITGGGGLTWIADTWQKWEVDYLVGADTYDLTIDGVQATGIPVHTAGGAAGAIRFGSRAGAEYFVDGVPVPEPSSLLLCGLGLLGLVSAAMRTRSA